MIIIQQDTLNSALNAVTRASLKSSLAAFSLVRLDARMDGQLILSCFNGETAARAITYAACDEDLSVCVDASTLKAIVETLAGEIHLYAEQNSLIVQSATNRTTLRLVSEELPTIEDESRKTLVTLPGGLFRSLIRVLPFASTDCSRMVLQVLHLIFDQNEVIAQTADGYSAAIVHENIEGIEAHISVSLPLGVARLLATLVDERDSVTVQTSGENRFLFQIRNADQAKDLTLATVTSEGTFPAEQINNLAQGARQNAPAILNVEQASLAQTIRMVQAMNAQSAFIKAINGIVKMASAETDTGQARNILEGSATGEDTSNWLSASYLKRAAEACKGELTIRISGKQQPVLVENGSFTAVIMPMLVEGSKDPFAEEEAIAITLPEMQALTVQSVVD